MGWTIRTPRYRYIEWRAADFSADAHHRIKSVAPNSTTTRPIRSNAKISPAKPSHAAVLKEHQALFDKLLPHLPKRDRQCDILGTGP